MKWIKFLSVLLTVCVLGLVGWACSSNSSNPAPDNSSSVQDTTKVFFSEKLKLGEDQYDSQLIQHQGSSGTSYWNLIKGRNLSRGTIIYVVPYTGIDWSGEDLDKRWSSNASALTGYFGNDVDGPLYDSTTSKPLFYQQIKKDIMPISGLGISFNGYDVLYVYNRFYAGRYADDYVQDVVDAIAWLKSKNSSEQIGLLGFSLGGFISAQVAARAATSDLKAVALISPLLSWPKQVQYLNDLNTLITDSTQRQGYLDFFEPYTRRFSNPESNLDLPQFSFPALMIHDQWDTLVPIAQADAFHTLNSTNVTYLKHFHSTGIDYMTMIRDHSQPGSGQNSDNVQPFYLAFLFNRIAPDTQPKFILYTQVSMDRVFSEMHSQKLAGKDIIGFQNSLKEFCQEHFIMYDTTKTAAPETGPTYLARKLNEVWGLTQTPSSICGYLDGSTL
jgi:pimeloyl-ACP methyl ester carboxylesterase